MRGSVALLNAYGPAALLALLGALAVAAAVHAGRGLTFYYDEWNFILGRRGISFETFLEPHGGDHPAVVPVAVYKVMLQVFGLGSYAPYRMLIIAAHVLCGVLLYVYARRRLGRWLALAPAALLLFLGSAWEDVLWPFQIGFVGSLAAGLGMLLVLDQDRPRDWLVCLLLVASLASSGLGLIFVVVAAVELAADPARLRRAWLVALPLTLLAVIYLVFGGEGPDRQLASPGNAVRYALDMAAAGAGALGGLGVDWGRPLLIAGVVLVAAVLWRLPAPPVRIVALAAGAATFWLLTGVSRAEWVPTVPSESSRYIYPSALLILLILVTALAGRLRVSRTGGALLAIAVGFACISGMGLMGDGGRVLRAVSVNLLPEMTALEVARDRVDPNLVVDPERAPVLVAGGYLDAIDSFGSPAPSLDAVRRDPAALPVFDAALARAEGLALQPVAASAPTQGGPPTVDGSVGGTVEARGACQRFDSQGVGAALDIALPPGAVTITAEPGPPVEVRFRRLWEGWPAAPATQLSGGLTGRLEVPPDALPGTWHMRLSPRRDVRVCVAA